jgi:hypothetical protein
MYKKLSGCDRFSTSHRIGVSSGGEMPCTRTDVLDEAAAMGDGKSCGKS